MGVIRMTPAAFGGVAPEGVIVLGLQTHVFRRGATYVWRKRLPTCLGGALMQVSLRTRDPLIARRIGLILGAEGCRVIDAMVAGKLTRDEARRLLQASIMRALEQVETTRANLPDSPFPNAWAEMLSDDWAAGKAYELAGHRGAAAAPISAGDRDRLRAEGRGAGEIEKVDVNAHVLVQSFAIDPKQGANYPAWRLMCDTLGRDDFSQGEVNHGRQIVYRGRGAALQVASRGHIASLDAAARAALDLAEGRVARAADVATAPQPSASVEDTAVAIVAKPAPTRPAPLYDPSLPALVDRLMAQKQRQKMSAQMIDQMRKVFDLFGEATGVDDIRDLRQDHLARFVDVLNQLPTSYRKSPKDRSRTLAQILDAAKGKPAGLSPTTINRNLDYIGQLLTKARSEGFSSVIELDRTSLRARKSHRDRDERPAFTPDDVQAIFRHPIWNGWKNRRDGNRGLKNLAAERTLPLHPQLIELGLMEHVRAAADGPRGGGPGSAARSRPAVPGVPAAGRGRVDSVRQPRV